MLKKSYGDKFSLIIDNFITNGFSFNRFLRIEYNEGKLKKNLMPLIDVDMTYEILWKTHIKNNISILSDSSLSKNIIEFVKDIIK